MTSRGEYKGVSNDDWSAKQPGGAHAVQTTMVKDKTAPVIGASASGSTCSGSPPQSGWPAQWSNGRDLDVLQWFEQHPGFAQAVNSLSDAISSRSDAASGSGSPASEIASAGTRAFALLSQMMANDFGNASHFAQAESSPAQTQQQTSNLLTRPLH